MSNLFAVLFGVIGIVLVILIDEDLTWRIKKESNKYLLSGKIIYILGVLEILILGLSL